MLRSFRRIGAGLPPHQGGNLFIELPASGVLCFERCHRRAGLLNRHLVTDGHGIPLAASLTSANTNEVTQALPLVDAVPPVGGKPGHPRRRPESLDGDRAYASESK